MLLLWSQSCGLDRKILIRIGEWTVIRTRANEWLEYRQICWWVSTLTFLLSARYGCGFQIFPFSEGRSFDVVTVEFIFQVGENNSCWSWWVNTDENKRKNNDRSGVEWTLSPSYFRHGRVVGSKSSAVVRVSCCGLYGCSSLSFLGKTLTLMKFQILNFMCQNSSFVHKLYFFGGILSWLSLAKDKP